MAWLIINVKLILMYNQSRYTKYNLSIFNSSFRTPYEFLGKEILQMFNNYQKCIHLSMKTAGGKNCWSTVKGAPNTNAPFWSKWSYSGGTGVGGFSNLSWVPHHCQEGKEGP